MNAIEEVIKYIDDLLLRTDNLLKNIFVGTYTYKYNKEPDEELIQRAITNIDFEDIRIANIFDYYKNGKLDDLLLRMFDDYQCGLQTKSLLLRLKLKIRLIEKEFNNENKDLSNTKQRTNNNNNS